MFRVGVKFCGSCNPYIDTVEIYREIVKEGKLKYVSWDDPPYDALLILNGCKSACTKIPDFLGPIIVMNEESDYTPEIKEKITDEIIRILHSYR